MGERKYRHHGYMEGYGQSRRRREAPKPPAEERKPLDPMLEDSPRGRTASGPGDDVFRCAGCGEALTEHDLIKTDTTCPRCGSDLHSCTHCRSFDTAARYECRQPIPERISPKNRRNTCSFYQPRTVLDLSGRGRTSLLTGQPTGAEDPRVAFERLFRK